MFWDFRECQAKHILRKENHTMDFSAKATRKPLTIDLGSTFLNEPPIGLGNILVEDHIGVYYPRLTGLSTPTTYVQFLLVSKYTILSPYYYKKKGDGS